MDMDGGASLAKHSALGWMSKVPLCKDIIDGRIRGQPALVICCGLHCCIELAPVNSWLTWVPSFAAALGTLGQP